VTARSPWMWDESLSDDAEQVFHRNVHDGVIVAVVSIDSVDGWRLSLAHWSTRKRDLMIEEITDARMQLLPHDIPFVMFVQDSLSERGMLHLFQYQTTDQEKQ
jgi:hypothetical protein